jgi:hypothetical protein
MVLLRDRAWWLPRILERPLPRVSIEGEGYFAKLDAERAAATRPAPKD